MFDFAQKDLCYVMEVLTPTRCNKSVPMTNEGLTLDIARPAMYARNK
jgi:hypothetical protein